MQRKQISWDQMTGRTVEAVSPIGRNTLLVALSGNAFVAIVANGGIDDYEDYRVGPRTPEAIGVLVTQAEFDALLAEHSRLFAAVRERHERELLARLLDRYGVPDGR